jgi:hypothetical protein
MAMNWVEREHRRETSLEASADALVEALFLAIKESVDSFNKLYRQDKPKVDPHPNKHHVALMLALPVPSTPGAHRPRVARAKISYDASAYTISARFEESKAKPVVLEIDVDDDGKAFLHGADSKSRVDTDAASELLLKTFLWELRGA